MKQLTIRLTMFSVILMSGLISTVFTSEGPQNTKRIIDKVEGSQRHIPVEFWNTTAHVEQPLHYVPKRLGHYSREDWTEIIDSTWGPGLSIETKLEIMLTFWNTIDTRFACFQDLELNWDSIWSVCSTEIADTVSKGRFGAILNHSSLALRESHTKCVDEVVSFYTATAPGVPLWYIGANGYNGHFGAGLTVLEDSTALVYLVDEPHPLGLEPGDVVLGYDRILWKDLYWELLEAQLPIKGLWGSSQSSFTHSILAACGQNWHLFDTIDIVKYPTGDTVHLATSLMTNHTSNLWATEQLEVAGVPFPDSYDSLVCWGIVEEVPVGYVYVNAWTDETGIAWRNALHQLTNNPDLIGIIVDFRANAGGNMFASYDGLSLLFDTTIETVGFAVRGDPNNHDSMVVASDPEEFKVETDSTYYYNRPIAMLVGPGTVSSGDQVALIMTKHPHLRSFGKPTSSAFNSPMWPFLHDFFFYGYAIADAFPKEEPGHYLTRDEFPVDENVWLTSENVSQGKDDVVEAALAWILMQDSDGDGISNSEDNCPSITNSDQLDVDYDSFGDLCDNCSEFFNPLQEDLDFDSEGDSCDIDIDGDEYDNHLDNCPYIPNFNQNDSDNDGVGDVCDNCPSEANPHQYDEDDNGVGDHCDGLLHIQSYEFPPCYLNLPFEYEFWAVGGIEPYYWTLLGGDVPYGLTFNGGSTATLSGTPVWKSTYFFTIELQSSDDPILIDTMNCKLIVIDPEQYICGDIDASSEIDISDAVYLITYIFSEEPEPDPLEAGDTDCSGAVDISDAVYLITFIFSGGPIPCATCK